MDIPQWEVWNQVQELYFVFATKHRRFEKLQLVQELCVFLLDLNKKETEGHICNTFRGF